MGDRVVLPASATLGDVMKGGHNLAELRQRKEEDDGWGEGLKTSTLNIKNHIQILRR